MFLNIICILILYKDRINFLEFFAWILTQSTFLQFWTPSCLREYGCGTPNGSLWTIGVMLQAYIVLWLVYKLLHNRSCKRWYICLTVATAINIISPYLSNVLPEILYKLYGQTFISYIWMFLLGAFFFEYFEKFIEYLTRFWLLALIGILALLYFDVDINGTYPILKTILLSVTIIGFAYKYKNIKIKNDYTYGFYIYHMVVINVFIQLGLIENFIYLVYVFLITMSLAVFSYHTVGRLSRKHLSVRT